MSGGILHSLYALSQMLMISQKQTGFCPKKEFCLPCKKSPGGRGLYLDCKKHGRDYIHLYIDEQKGLFLGGILSYTQIFILTRFSKTFK